MRTYYLKGLMMSCVLLLGTIAFSNCTKEDDGLTQEARETIAKLKGDYSLGGVNYIPKTETKATFLVLVDSEEAKNFTGVNVSIEGQDGSYDKGTIKVQIPLYQFVTNFFTLFNEPVPQDFAQCPATWNVEVKYSVDDKGNVLFPDYDFDELGNYLASVKLNFDEQTEELTLDVVTNFDDAFFSSVLNMAFLGNFDGGTIRITFNKTDKTK